MNYIQTILPFAAAAVAAVLAARALFRSNPEKQRIFFSLSSLCVAGVSVMLGLLTLSRTPAAAMSGTRAVLVTSLAASALIICYFISAGKDRLSDRDTVLVSTCLVWGFIMAGAMVFLPVGMFVAGIHFLREKPGYFWGMTISARGKAVCGLILLVNVFVLHRMENLFRRASIPAKVALKYPMLGIITASALNLTVFSRILAVSTLDRDHISVLALGTLIAAGTFLYSALRYRPFKISVAKDGRTSTISILVTGTYLLALALVSYVSSVVGLSYDRFTLYLLLLSAGFLVLAVGISGKARRYIRSFISDNFQPDKYNYRKEWRRFSRIMKSSGTMGDLLGSTIGSICETMLVGRGYIWMNVTGAGTANYGPEPDPASAAFLKELAADTGMRESVIFFEGPRFGGAFGKGAGDRGIETNPRPEWIKAVSILRTGGETLGIIALGKKDTAGRYTEEDRNFLSTISEQLVTAVENLILEEKIIESDRVQSFNRFASFVIHDLKNTMGMLSLTAENAKRNMDDPAFRKDAIETIDRAAEKINRLIGSLRARGTEPSLVRKRMDLGNLIEGMRPALERTAAARGIKTAFELEKGLHSFVDPEAVRRIMENLVSNSAEAGEPGGEISVGVREGSEGGIDVYVSDNGRGFDRSYLKNDLFKPFNSTKKEGLGVGLVMCKSLVEAHSGVIIVESEEGGGATVTFTLPRAAES